MTSAKTPTRLERIREDVDREIDGFGEDSRALTGADARWLLERLDEEIALRSWDLVPSVKTCDCGLCQRKRAALASLEEPDQ